MLEDFIDIKKDCIGIVGRSFALSALSLLLHESSREAAGISIEAGVLIDESGSPLQGGHDFPLYADVDSMISAHPSIEMVFELSGEPGIGPLVCVLLCLRKLLLWNSPQPVFSCVCTPLTVYGSPARPILCRHRPVQIRSGSVS